MIKNIIELLNIDHFHGKSELIEIAKGKYKAPETWRDVFKNVKRRIKWQLKRQ